MSRHIETSHRLYKSCMRWYLCLTALASAVALVICLTGCGHSLFHKVEGTGAYFRIPTPDGGGSLLELAMGDMTITSGVLRGGAVYDDNASKGGTFGSASLGRRTYMATTPAITEGNLRDVFTSKDTDKITKQLIAEYLITRDPVIPSPSSTTAVNAGSSTGGESAPIATPTRTGVDHITSTIGDTAPKVVEPIAKAVPKVVAPIADATASTVKDVSKTVETVSGDVKDVSMSWRNVVVLVVCAICGIGCILFGYFFMRFIHKRKQTNQ